MNNVSLFEPALTGGPADGPKVHVRFDGRDLELPEGANLAAALLAAGIRKFRETPASGAPRAPFCMMGACFDCLVIIDGETHQACMTEVTEGLEISSPRHGEPEQGEVAQ